MTKERITLREARNLALQVQRDADERLIAERQREAALLEDPRVAELEAENARLRAELDELKTRFRYVPHLGLEARQPESGDAGEENNA